MRTIYIQRTTEDPEEDMSVVRDEVDWFVDGVNVVDGRGGLCIVADVLSSAPSENLNSEILQSYR
jgi:hypothetical protein